MATVAASTSGWRTVAVAVSPCSMTTMMRSWPNPVDAPVTVADVSMAILCADTWGTRTESDGNGCGICVFGNGIGWVR